jgi:hypothetical protein
MRREVGNFLLSFFCLYFFLISPPPPPLHFARSTDASSILSCFSLTGDVTSESEADVGSLGSLGKMDFRDPFQFAGYLKRQMESTDEEFYCLTIEKFTLKTNGMTNRELRGEREREREINVMNFI